MKKYELETEYRIDSITVPIKIIYQMRPRLVYGTLDIAEIKDIKAREFDSWVPVDPDTFSYMIRSKRQQDTLYQQCVNHFKQEIRNERESRKKDIRSRDSEAKV